MGVGVCRHCQRSGVAHNAPLCPGCGGEDPCPHVGAARKWAFVAAGGVLAAVSGWLFLAGPGGDSGYFTAFFVGLMAYSCVSFGLGFWGRNVLK